MVVHYIIQGMFVIVGILSLVAAIMNWDWLFTAQNARFFVNQFGRKWARVCYAVLGGLMIFIGIYFFMAVRETLAH